jgi:hypothetical protein
MMVHLLLPVIVKIRRMGLLRMLLLWLGLLLLLLLQTRRGGGIGVVVRRGVILARAHARVRRSLAAVRSKGVSSVQRRVSV